MFNLEQSIAEWRQQILATGIERLPMDELESHLREEIGRQIKSGMDVQQAFETTISRIGQPEELKTEFAKDRGAFGFLGNDNFTKTNRILGLVWLAFSSCNFVLILCRVAFFRPLLHSSGQATAFFTAMSTLLVIHGTGILGSLLLLRGAKWGRHIIRIIAAFFLLVGILFFIVFKSLSIRVGFFDAFYFATIWFLFSRSYARPNTATK